MKPKIGDRAKDIVTGFTGIITGKHKWISGCDTVTLQSQEMHNGEPVKTRGCDINCIEVLERGAVKANDHKLPAREKVGGPRDTPAQTAGVE